MKNILALVTAFSLTLAISGTAPAGCGKDGGCGNCNQGGPFSQAKPAVLANGETGLYRQFRQDTIDLRQEMMNKRFELQRENLKGTPDAARIAGLKADITAIQVKISQVRVQNGLPDEGKLDGECFKMDGGCNGQPCWQK